MEHGVRGIVQHLPNNFTPNPCVRTALDLDQSRNRILVEQPAIWTMPLSLGLMFAVSKATAAQVPADIQMKMLVLHAPEELGLKQEYIQEHAAGAGH